MNIEELTDDQKKRLQECGSADEFMSVLAEEGVELSDEQLEAVVGGVGVEWSLETFVSMFGDILSSISPDGFDSASLWSNLPLGGSH